MAYDPAADFLALIRQTSGGARIGSMPGLDYVVAALERMGFCTVWANPDTPPTDTTTVWLKTSSTSWAAEGSVFLFNVRTDNWEPATPTLWRDLSSGLAGYVFQLVTTGAANVGALTTMLAVQRDNPGITTLALPTVAGRTTPLQIVDWSTNVAAHQLLYTPNGIETIMRRSNFSSYSTPDQLAGITLFPVPDLNGWVIAP